MPAPSVQSPQTPFGVGDVQRILRALQGQAIRAASAVLDRLSVSGNIDCQNLTVRGRVAGKLANVTGLVALSGGWPASGTVTVPYASNAMILWSGTSFNTAGGQVNNLNLFLDGSLLDLSPMYINPANVHTTHPTTFSTTTLSAGTHTLQITVSGANSASDAGDRAKITVLLLP